MATAHLQSPATIQARCPACQAALRLPVTRVNTRCRCPQCQHSFVPTNGFPMPTAVAVPVGQLGTTNYVTPKSAVIPSKRPRLAWLVGGTLVLIAALTWAGVTILRGADVVAKTTPEAPTPATPTEVSSKTFTEFQQLIESDYRERSRAKLSDDTNGLRSIDRRLADRLQEEFVGKRFVWDWPVEETLDLRLALKNYWHSERVKIYFFREDLSPNTLWPQPVNLNEMDKDLPLALAKKVAAQPIGRKVRLEFTIHSREVDPTPMNPESWKPKGILIRLVGVKIR